MKIIYLLIFIMLKLSASFLSDKDKLIVTHPYFEKDRNELYSYFGVEENVKDKKKSYIIKFDIKKNRVIKTKELGDIDLDIKGNIQSIKYKLKNAYIVFLTKINMTKIIIFDNELETLYKKDIYSKVKNSGTVVDINNDGLFDIVFQTNDTLYLLLKNSDDEGFEKIEVSLKNDYQNRNYSLFTRLGKPYIMNNGKSKFIIVYYTQYGLKNGNFKDSYLAFYKYENKKLIRDNLYLLNKLGHRSKMDMKSINNKVYFAMPLDRDFFEYGELKNQTNNDLNIEIKGKLREGFYSSDSMKYFHEINHKIINFNSEAYYLMLDKSRKYEENKLYIARLSDGQIVNIIDRYTPYESIKRNSASFRTSIDLTLILNEENKNYDTYINNRIKKQINFISPINKNLILSEKIEDTSSKYVFATEDNITYMLGYNKSNIFARKLENEYIKFAPFKKYNNLLNETNYIITNNTLKSIIPNLTNTLKDELEFLYKVTELESFNELYKKIDTIKSMLEYQKVDKIDEKLYNYFSNNFKNDKDNLTFNSIFIDKILSSFNHSFENYFDNLNKLNELNKLINDRRVKKLRELYINCNESFRLYKELKKENKLKIDSKFNELAKSFEYLKGGECIELTEDINNIFKEKEQNKKIIARMIYISILIIVIILIILIYTNKFILEILWVNYNYKKKRFVNFNKFYLLNGKNLFDYLKSQNIENNYRKSFPIEDEYFEKISKLTISDKTNRNFVDKFYSSLIMIYNKDIYRDNFELEIKTDEAFIFALRKLDKLLKLKLFENYFSIFEACCKFVYINPEKSKNFMKKSIFTKESMLLNEFKEIKRNLDLQSYFVNQYKFNKKYNFQEKSKILIFLFNYISIELLKIKIIKLNNIAFEDEKIVNLKDKYLITSLQSDKSVLKTFQALSLKDNAKVIIRYYDKNSNYNYITQIEKGIEFDKVKFVDMYEFIESEKYNISIENCAESMAIPKLIRSKNISDFKIKEIINILIDYLRYLIEEKNIKYLPNLHPSHLFYDKQNNKLIIVCYGHNKALVDRDVILGNIQNFKEFFQTPEFRKYEQPNNLMNSIIKDISVGNKKILDRELVYQVAMTLYFFLSKKLPYKESNIINQSYKIEFKKYGMEDSDKLKKLLNSVLDTNPNNFEEIFQRLSLAEFKSKLKTIYFNNINPFHAGGKLDYTKYQEVIVKRNKSILDVIDKIIQNRSKNFLIQSNKRMGKSTFLSQIEYEVKLIENKNIYIIFIVLNAMNFKEPIFYNLANIIYKDIINQDIKTYYKSPNLEEFRESEFEAFISYLKYIIELSGKELVLLIDEFEETLIELYSLHQRGEIDHFNYNYIVNFKNMTDRVDGIYNFLISSVNFKLLKDKTNNFNPEALNDAYQIILPTLTIEETKELINNEKIINDGLKFSDEIIEEIFQETNGHPLFIQNICHEIINFKNKNKDKVFKIDSNYFGNNKKLIYEKLFKSHSNAFKELWNWVLTDKEQEIIKNIVKNKLNYTKVEQELIEILENSFLIQDFSKNKYEVSVPIFKEWIEKNILRFDDE